MCRSIKTLYNLAPPADEEEVRAAALQFVRKVSGYRVPSQANADPFARAVDQITQSVVELFDELSTSAPPRDRAEMTIKAKARAAKRTGNNLR